MRTVKSTPHNHLRTTDYITEDDANSAVTIANERLGAGGVFGVINFNPSPNELDYRWRNFVKNLRNYDIIHTKNGIYIEERDILVVKGQEVPTKEGYHVLLIGTCEDQNVTNNSSLDDVLDEGDKFGAIKVADHPFHKNGIGDFLYTHRDYISRFDSIETGNGIAINGAGFKDANEKASNFYHAVFKEYLDLTESVSDDGHSIHELGRNYSNIAMPENYTLFKDSPEKVVNALKDGYLANRYQNLGHKLRTTKIGAINHFLDLAFLKRAQKVLGWDPNRKTAPFLQRLGIKI